ncbi:MAG: carboxypeptidase-like regulatory domain-containing protein [Terracidiphilus sp.]|nr:carboxypeptidase-like regulatory domain-containing protein [Terracidiphilus sp.]
MQIVLGHTGLDGGFRMDGVPAGDYLAIARMPGYVAPGTSSNLFATDDQLKRLIVSVPTVQVVAGQVTSVNLTLRRGAAISGRVQFADGSPMVGASVGWELAEANLAIESIRMTKSSSLQRTMMTLEIFNDRSQQVVTDEEGRYRIFGLSPGNYIVSTGIASQLTSAAQVILSDGSSPEPSRRVNPYPEITTVYAPGVFRRGDAKVIEIRGSEQVTNADVKVDPSGLRTVRGRVLAGEDRHVPSQAMVRIQEDGGKEPFKFIMIEEDGSFKIDYPLPGNYTLQVTGVDEERSTANPPDAPAFSRRYQLAKLPVVVGGRDVVVADVLLSALKPGEKEEYPQ